MSLRMSTALWIGLATVAGADVWTLEAFSGAGGTGASLGLFSSVAFNFQNNNLYFMV